MVVELDGEAWYGAEAVWLMSSLSSRSGRWNRLLAAIFASRQRSKLLYPVMRFGHRVTLFLLGREPLS